MEMEEDPIVQLRRRAIEETMEKFPVLGEFSPEQYAQGERSMGSVYVPEKRWSKFTNLKSKHIKYLFRALYMNEVAAATRERRAIDTGRIVANFEIALGDINGWRSGQYIRTSPLGPLQSTSLNKPGWLERRRLKKQGGW